MLKNLALIITSVSMVVCGQVSLKIGMNKVGEISSTQFKHPVQTLIKMFSNPHVSVGLSLYACAYVIWLIVLSRVDLSFAFPMMGLSYVFILFISKFLLKEDVMPFRWLGAVLICTGVVIISRTN